MKLETLGYAIPNIDVNAMVKALRDCPEFTIERERTTILVKNKTQELFRAMQHSNRRNWLVRTVPNLFN